MPCNFTEFTSNSCVCVCVISRAFYIYDHVVYKQRYLYLFLSKLNFLQISFSCLLDLARPSSTMLKKTGKAGTIVLFLILGKSFFNPVYNVGCGFFQTVLYCVEELLFYSWYIVFLSEESVEFCQMLLDPIGYGPLYPN